MVDMQALERVYEAWNRRDLDALLALADPDVEIQPLVGGITSTGPWHGHDGVRRLVTDAQERWYRFEMRLDDFLEVDGNVIAFVHVVTEAFPGAPVVEGDVAHVLRIEDGRFTRFAGYRDRKEAIAVVTS
jgi:ketosteroid isomerase-like protein